MGHHLAFLLKKGSKYVSKYVYQEKYSKIFQKKKGSKYVSKKIRIWGPQSIAFSCLISVAKNGRYNELVTGRYNGL